jgi:sortase (surface protein transpeptidase)
MNMKGKKIEIISNAYLIIGIVLIVLGTLMIVIARFPQVWYSLQIHTSESELNILTSNINKDFRGYVERKPEKQSEEQPLPNVDSSLPKENRIIIPKVGINAKIHEGEDYRKPLEKGVWRVNEFGTPEDDKLMILVAHRFGYSTWSREKREKEAFFNLPNTRVGDRLDVIWNQRLYVYEIYKVDEDTQITDYSADLILYTCKLYNSPVRIFRYAVRIN